MVGGKGSEVGHLLMAIPTFLFSTQPIAPSLGPDLAAGGGNEPAVFPAGSPSTPVTFDGDEPSQQISHIQTQRTSASSGSFRPTSRQGIYSHDRVLMAVLFISKSYFPLYFVLTTQYTHLYYENLLKTITLYFIKCYN